MNPRTLIVRALTLVSACLLAVGSVSAGDVWKAAEMDWPHWRGPEMNGISREKGLVESWSPDGENLLWKNEELGSRSTPIVMNGKLYTIVRDQPETKFEGEKAVCVDPATGKILWTNRFNVFLSDVPDTRVGWSCVTGDPETGNVFVLGVCGYFQCLDGKTGKTLWSHSLSEEYGLLSTYGGRTNVPLIHGNLVIISSIVIGWGEMAKPAHRFVAFDKRNGQAVWFTGTRVLPYDTTYSSPIATVINGQAAMIFGSGDGGVHAFQPRTGKNIWTYNVSRRGINITPLFVDNTVYCGHSEENIGTSAMGALFALDATKTGDITKSGVKWRVNEWYVGKSSPIMVDGKLIAIEDKANLLIVDPKTGKLIAKKKLGTMMRSSPLYADGKIYTCTANGRWYILKLTDSGVDIVHKLRLDGEGNYGSPIVSHGRIYLPTTRALYCIGTKDAKPQADPRPTPPQESPVEDDQKVAQVQLVPAESLLLPGPTGQRQGYNVRLYNSRGQFLRMAKPAEVEFSVAGSGSIDKSGKYSTPKENVHAAVIVSAKVGDIAGQARIRVVPKLPWSFDFSDGAVPITWVGARYRHILIDYALFDSLTKQNPRAGQLYLQVMTSFINSGRPAAKFDDSTPRRSWSGLLRFLGLDQGDNRPQSVDAAKQVLDPSLELLAKEKVIAKWDWAASDSGPQLTVQRGPRKVDGNGVVVKIKTIPKGTRSQSWMGHTSFHDYTIQADVLGAIKDNKLPDIGLIGQRYTMDMMGASQQLQIRTWPPQLRMAKTIAFAWKPNVWYTMKLRTAVEDGKAVLRGKVWVRGKPEPKNWLLEAVDESPNLIGSPGLFGNAKDAEIFYDNIKVTPNAG